jgi:hypothetical protein
MQDDQGNGCRKKKCTRPLRGARRLLGQEVRDVVELHDELPNQVIRRKQILIPHADAEHLGATHSGHCHSLGACVYWDPYAASKERASDMSGSSLY